MKCDGRQMSPAARLARPLQISARPAGGLRRSRRLTDAMCVELVVVLN